MKNKHWIALFLLLALGCGIAALTLFSGAEATHAQIRKDGTLIKTVNLAIDQEFSVDGHNTVTVKDGKIAVTWADCPDGYCVSRGFRSSGGDIVCLPNRLVISFTGEQEIDGVVG